MDDSPVESPTDSQTALPSHRFSHLYNPELTPPQRLESLPSKPDTETGTAYDTCRICRSEGTPDEPLFYPCKCSGSIKFVHQECLMEWLSHSHKKHCELCKTPFRFTKLYDADMPRILPWTVFMTRAALHVTITVLRVFRGILVGTVWLVALPWLIRWAWRWMFWFADAGWAIEAFVKVLEVQHIQSKTTNSTSLAGVLNYTLDNAGNVLESFPGNLDRALRKLDIVRSLDRAISFASRTANSSNSTSASRVNLPPIPEADASLLSSWTYISQLTSSARLNRMILDIFEGQLITCVVITGFILVFLIREWVVQQQPLVNLDILNNEERERERQQREVDRMRQRTEQTEQETPRPTPGPLDRSTQDASQQSELETVIPTFIGWDAFYDLMDEIRVQDPGLGKGTSADAAYRAVMQVWAAQKVLDDREVSERIFEKLATYPERERLIATTFILKTMRKNPTRTQHGRNTDVADDSDESDEFEVSSGRRRPPMPERDMSSRATQILRSLEEAEVSTRSQDRQTQYDNAASEMGFEQLDTDSPLSSSTGSWQHISIHEEDPPRERSLNATFDNDEIPITNAGPDAKINIKRSTQSNARPTLEVKSHSTMPHNSDVPSDSTRPDSETTRLDTSEPSSSLAVDPPMEVEADPFNQGDHNPFHPDGPDPEPVEPDSLRNRMASAFREEFGLERDEDPENPQQPRAELAEEATQQAANNHDEVAPGAPPAAQHGMLGQLANWFWGDIQPRDPPPRPTQGIHNEDRVADGEQDQEGRVPPAANGRARLHPELHQGQPHGQQPEQVPPGNDADAVAPAQQAGLDAEAIEDAEDLEGIFELIGFQGPLIGLFQTSCFCSILVTGTVFAAVGLPYIWGKLVLLFIGNPTNLILKLPLQLGSTGADIIIDLTLLIIGWAMIVVSLSFNYLLSAFEAWVPIVANYDVTEWLLDVATSTAQTAGARLQAFFITADPSDKWDMKWAVLGASVHAHASLREMQDEMRMVLTYTGEMITATIDTISTGSIPLMMQRLFKTLANTLDIRGGLTACTEIIGHYLQPMIDAIGNLKTGAVTFQSPKISIDPSLVYWSSTDRMLTVMTGYTALAAVAAVYVALDTPITKSPAGRKTEKIIRDTLRQAGGVLKVILIISIEMLVFPLYCGLLLDFAFLPLFQGASVSTRWAFAIDAPYTFGFVHWFVGTCYMFHFALFVGMCRKILRKGVLWFIRDPDDPTFHPVRDVLERNVSTQLRKIAFSALVYGALVILCLGGVIWSIGHIFKGIFPIHWISTEPLLEFPLDLLLYNLITPFVVRLFKPSDAVHALYAWWLRRCARMLRLSHFLFNDQRKDEEDRHTHRWWSSFLPGRNTGLATANATGDGETNDGPAPTAQAQQDGRYVLTPCNDQYRPPKPGEAFLHVYENEMYIADKDGKKNEHFAQIYVPPYFGARVTLFMMCLWMFSVFAGLSATLVPLVLGRSLLAQIMPPGPKVNDIYAYSIGAYTYSGLWLLLFHGRSIVSAIHEWVSTLEVQAWVSYAARYTGQLMKCAYVYGFFGVGVPVFLSLLMQFYLILPLHTYMHSTDSITTSSLAANGTSSIAGNTTDSTTAFVQFPGHDNQHPSPRFVDHNIHLLSDYALGLLYLRIAMRIIMGDPASRVAEALRRVTDDGYFNPNAWLATRFFVLPTALFAALAFFLPVTVATGAVSVLDLMGFPVSATILQNDTIQTMLYRYSYPLAGGWALLVWGSLEVAKATGRWRSRIRDEVYLVGERLHNFGEKKPPVGSRSVIRKDK